MKKILENKVKKNTKKKYNLKGGGCSNSRKLSTTIGNFL